LVRFAGKRLALKGISNYVDRRQKVDNEQQGEAVRNYMYQIIMRKSTTDCSIIISFSLGLICHDPLNTKDKLSSGSFPIPVSFIYGDLDWV
jgi:pimeloyl-ACP methyl ester carboxylesterase